MTKDQMKGRLEVAKGEIRKVTGKAIGNKDLESKGNVQKAVGIVQARYGDFKKIFSRKYE